MSRIHFKNYRLPLQHKFLEFKLFVFDVNNWLKENADEHTWEFYYVMPTGHDWPDDITAIQPVAVDIFDPYIELLFKLRFSL